MNDTLYFVIPCYNEAEAIGEVSAQLLDTLEGLKRDGMISPESGVLFVDDGSRDDTWNQIESIVSRDKHARGILLNRNYGQQVALYAGMTEVGNICDIVITLDADGQQSLEAVKPMIEKYHDGSEIVCAVRKNNNSESVFKRLTSELYYRVAVRAGVSLIKNHSDYRLVSVNAINELKKTAKQPLFLRSDFLKLSLQTSVVEYDCNKRIAGRSKYSASKMLRLASDGLCGSRKSGSGRRKEIDYEIAKSI